MFNFAHLFMKVFFFSLVPNILGLVLRLGLGLGLGFFNAEPSEKGFDNAQNIVAFYISLCWQPTTAFHAVLATDSITVKSRNRSNDQTSNVFDKSGKAPFKHWSKIGVAYVPIWDTAQGPKLSQSEMLRVFEKHVLIAQAEFRQ
jgi:hypothetical protein